MRGESFDVVIAGSGPAGAVAATVLPPFTRALHERGLLADGQTHPRRGGWLRMGISGCVPAQGRAPAARSLA